ncbi:Histone H2A [Micractinium conductrix]|uniref:Histone H2A n=1 Tax=Micractinium conductrix TaxID=554055 RepID=A0A2P6VDT6_9CHLO|nr:Histone H2A [Micractinium conductrix]|eukprot:PSC72221.1 Histone H2A [Micractinium conductrix]
MSGRGKGKTSGKKAVSKSSKAGLQFPVGRIARYLKKGRYAERIGAGAPVYLAAVLEYLAAEVLELAGNAARDNKKTRIIPRHIQLAVRNDEELSKLLAGVTIAEGGVLPNIHSLLRGFLSVSRSILSGEEPSLVASAGLSDVPPQTVQAVGSSVLAAALATWQLSVADAPSNKGLQPSILTMFERDHYYQFVFFHGCQHLAFHSWPYDPKNCPECLGLPEEVAHTKQALAWGYAALAVESKDKVKGCFSASGDPVLSDANEAALVVQSFLEKNDLLDKPIYVAGVSAGASFAVKLPKTLYSAGYTYKIAGVISEVNGIDWSSWGMVDSKGALRWKGFPPVAYVQMERGLKTAARIADNMPRLRALGIPSDMVEVPSRPINERWFSDRAPTISPEQSSAIVQALQELGVLDKEGWLADDPRAGLKNTSSPLCLWNEKLLSVLPWLNMEPDGQDRSLNLVPDCSAITEEMNTAYAWHDGVADFLRPCLAWLQSGGAADLRYLASRLAVSNLAELTMEREYPEALPPAPPMPPPPPG